MGLELLAIILVNEYMPFNVHAYNSLMVILYPFKQVQQAFPNNCYHSINFFEKDCVLELPPLL